MSEKPGYKWRLQVGGEGDSPANNQESDGKTLFDELVIDNWFHLEQMDENSWWMRVGPLAIRITPDLTNGTKSAITVEDNESGTDEYLIKALGDFAKKYCLDEFKHG